eukprot:3582135-Pyramimonas_sp.AAC.1
MHGDGDSQAQALMAPTAVTSSAGIGQARHVSGLLTTRGWLRSSWTSNLRATASTASWTARRELCPRW